MNCLHARAHCRLLNTTTNTRTTAVPRRCYATEAVYNSAFKGFPLQHRFSANLPSADPPAFCESGSAAHNRMPLARSAVAPRTAWAACRPPHPMARLPGPPRKPARWTPRRCRDVAAKRTRMAPRARPAEGSYGGDSDSKGSRPGAPPEPPPRLVGQWPGVRSGLC